MKGSSRADLLRHKSVGPQRGWLAELGQQVTDQWRRRRLVEPQPVSCDVQRVSLAGGSPVALRACPLGLPWQLMEVRFLGFGSIEVEGRRNEGTKQ